MDPYLVTTLVVDQRALPETFCSLSPGPARLGSRSHGFDCRAIPIQYPLPHSAERSLPVLIAGKLLLLLVVMWFQVVPVAATLRAGMVQLRPSPGAGEHRRRHHTGELRPARHAGPRQRPERPVVPGLQAGLQRRPLRPGLVDHRPADPQLRDAGRLRGGLDSRGSQGPGPVRARVHAAGSTGDRVAELRPRLLAAAEHRLRRVRRRPDGVEVRLEQVRARHRRQPRPPLRLRVPPLRQP